MRRLTLIIAATTLVAAPSAFAQDAPAAPAEDTIVVPGSRIVRQDFEAISPGTIVSSEHLEIVGDKPAWTSDADSTSSRTGGRASSTRVIRACEISLTLDGDCAGR